MAWGLEWVTENIKPKLKDMVGKPKFECFLHDIGSIILVNHIAWLWCVVTEIIWPVTSL